jgi:heme-degrading monooxygenase HmoA
MYCASFIWEPGVYDSEFHRLNELIEEVAQSLPGYLGSESWQSREGSRNCANYYWKDLDTLKAFSAHPTHLEAKRQYASWYKGYHIVVSEVIRTYGDGNLPHITPNDHNRLTT